MGCLKCSNIKFESNGYMVPGSVKMTINSIRVQNQITGEIEKIRARKLDTVRFQNLRGTLSLKIFLKNGDLHRLAGFRYSDKDKLTQYFSTWYNIKILEKESSGNGRNWVPAKLSGSVSVGKKNVSEVPLKNVSQCTSGKNEVTTEIQENDNAPVNLMESVGDVDPVKSFHENVTEGASAINVSNDAIAIFRLMFCFYPHGIYNIKIFSTFLHFDGKMDFKIPISTVSRLFILPHYNKEHLFFVVSLDSPITQGTTDYTYIVIFFHEEQTTSIELPFTEKELNEKFDNKLEKNLSGPTYKILQKLMKTINSKIIVINRKLTGPGSFISNTGAVLIQCSYKSTAGFLYPLKKAFIYIYKPTIHIKFDEISSVNCVPTAGTRRSFDFEIEVKAGTVHTFSGIQNDEYMKLTHFILSKKLHYKNMDGKRRTSSSSEENSEKESVSSKNGDNSASKNDKANKSKISSSSEEELKEECDEIPTIFLQKSTVMLMIISTEETCKEEGRDVEDIKPDIEDTNKPDNGESMGGISSEVKQVDNDGDSKINITPVKEDCKNEGEEDHAEGE